MKIKKLILGFGGTALLTLGMMTNAYAVDTLVQYSTTGIGDGVTDGAAGGYDVVGINEFDWQSSGDLVVNNVVSAGSNFTNFQSFVSSTIAGIVGSAVAVNGVGAFISSVDFDIHAHARLNDMINNAGGSVAPGGLDTNGAAGGDAGFEITAAISATETALFIINVFDGNGDGIVQLNEIVAQNLNFQSITGTFAWYHDDTPDSNVETGAGFINGDVIVSGNITATGGSATVDANGVFTGSSTLSNEITFYDGAYIQTDPTLNQPLSGTSFDTLLTLRSSGEAAAHDAGDVIGLDPYTVGADDLGLKADANSEFSASPVPEPQSLFLLSLGLLGLGATSRKRK